MMSDRRELLVITRRIPALLQAAVLDGPDGTLEGKFAAEHPVFVNHACGFYLAGCLAYLEGTVDKYLWESPGAEFSDFDSFLSVSPAPPRDSYAVRGITKCRMIALAEIRNAVVHNRGDISRNWNPKSVAIVVGAALPGVSLQGSIIVLDYPFLEFVRLATYAVRHYHGER